MTTVSDTESFCRLNKCRHDILICFALIFNYFKLKGPNKELE